MWQKDTEMDKSTRRLVATEKDQELQNFHENLKSRKKLVASGNSDIDGIGTIWAHSLHLSTAYVSPLEKVLSNVRQRYGRKPGDKMEDPNVNTIMWWMFMSVTLQAAVHLGKDYAENLHSVKNQPKRTLKQILAGETLDASERHARRLNAKEIVTPNKGENFIFTIAEWNKNCLEENTESGNSISMRDQPVRGEEISGDLPGSSEKSQPTDEMADDREARNDFWSIEGNYIYRRHVDP